MWSASDHRGRDRGREDSSGGDALQALELLPAQELEPAQSPPHGLYQEEAWRYWCVVCRGSFFPAALLFPLWWTDRQIDNSFTAKNF